MNIGAVLIVCLSDWPTERGHLEFSFVKSDGLSAV